MINKIVLMGNPNVGKSVVFSRLTGANVISSNYPGTTVDYSKGKMRLQNQYAEVIDAPGTYSLEPSNKAEEVAKNILKKADIVINVIDATNLERNLHLTLELLEQNIPVIVVLNLWDETKHLGIDINEKKLAELLDTPVIPTVALTGEGIKELVDHIPTVQPSTAHKKRSEEERWITIGHLISEVEHIGHRHHSLRDRISDLTIRPVTGLPIAIGVIFCTFGLVVLLGEALTTYILEPIFANLYQPLLMQLSTILGPGLLQDILIGQLIQGEIDFELSLGVLTTGVYVPFGIVLPFIITFYFFLSLLEDTGYLPRLATLMDNLFHRLGMHGFGIIPLFLGLGCNVTGALATRTLETRKQRFIAATLLSISVPCMAQTAMIFGVLGSQGFYYVGLVILTLLIVYITAGLLLNKFITGTSPEIFLEIPHYRIPSLRVLLQKTWMRVRWFLKEAVPFLFIGVFVISILFAAGILQWLSTALNPLMNIFGLPGDASIAMVTGFFRKDLAVGLLVPLNLQPLQLVIAVTMLTIYFPCVATFIVLLRELGVKDMVKAAVIMVSTATLVGIALNLILLGG